MNRLISAILVALALCASAAHAQGDPTAPPFRSVIDENNVDLLRAAYMGSATDVSIGPADHRGLRHARYWQGAWRNLNVPKILSGNGGFTVTFSGASNRFTWDAANNRYEPDARDGSTLSNDRSLFTGSDGTTINFQPTSYWFDTSFPYALGSQVTFPDGTKWTFTYESYSNCSSCSSYSSATRLKSINSSTGYQLKYTYSHANLHNPPQSFPDDDIYWLMLTKVTAINNAVEYCDPNVNECTLSNSWPKAEYTYANGNAGHPTNLNAFKDAENRISTYSYSSSDQLVGIRRPAATTNDITIGYTSGKVSSVQKAGSTWSYTLSGGTSTVTDPQSNSRTITFDTTTFLVSNDTERDAANNIITQRQYQYCVTGDTDCPVALLKKSTAREGNATAFRYDSRGNIIETRWISKTPGTPPDIVTTASYPSGCASTKTCNKPDWTKDAKGNQSDFTYDTGHGGILTATYPPDAANVRPQVRYSYVPYQAYYKKDAGSPSASGFSVAMLTDISTCQSGSSCTGTANEARTTIAYGPQTAGVANNLLPVTRSNSAGDNSLVSTATMTYDDVGNLKTVDGPLSGSADTYRFRYNASRQQTGIVTPDPGAAGMKPRAQRISYGGDGQVSSTEAGTVVDQSDAAWANFVSLQKLTSSYDTYGRKTRDVLTGYNPATATTQTYAVTEYSYDPLGRPLCTAVRMNASAWGTALDGCTMATAGSVGPDRITKRIYDAVGRISQTQSAYGSASQINETTLSYTANGKIQTLADAKDNLTTYEYDGFDRLSKTRYPSPTTPNSSSTTDYEQPGYDANGNVTALRLRDGSSIGFAYDNLNRLTFKDLPGSELDVSYAYDLIGRQTIASQSGNALGFTYDALNRNLTQTGPLGTVTSTWDIGGRRTRLDLPGGYYTTYDYLVTGEMTAIRESGATSGPGVLATFGYNDLGSRTGLTRGNGTGTGYTPDAISRLSSLSQDLASAASDQTLGFSYNPASQIVARSSSNDAYAMRQQYNASRGYTVNGLNQYTAAGSVAPTYDARGNMTNAGNGAIVYTSENMMSSAPGAGAITYDPAMRLYQLVGSGTTRFLYDGNDLVAEYDGAGTLLRRYVHGPGTDEPLVWYEGTGTTDRRWLHADERGSVIAVSDGSGNALAINAYDEWGNPQSNNLGRFGYTGQTWLADIGMWYYKARMYNARLGRFMQTDPIGYQAGMNLYAYVRNDPVNFADPSGYYRTCINTSYYQPGSGYPQAEPGNILVLGKVTRTECTEYPSWAGPDANAYPPSGSAGVASGGAGSAPAAPQNVDCNTRLPNGKTVGDYVRDQRANLQSMADATMQSEGGPLPAAIGAMAAIAWPNGPIDFKNNFRGQANAGMLGRAGNFAYYAIGTGILPNAMLDAGAGAYAITSTLRGHKSWSTLTGPMFSDQSAASVRDSALASGGCPK